MPNGEGVGVCQVACAEHACDRYRVPRVARCTHGRCTLGIDCSQGESRCSAPAPCVPGRAAPILEQGCSEGCLAATECASVTSCDACGDALCVGVAQFNRTTFRCISKPPECEIGSLCECLNPCEGQPCSEHDGAIDCSCPFC